jgi:hypothetical protein
MENLNITLSKPISYDLKPFGNFIIKWLPKKRTRNTIPLHELEVYDETTVPMSKEQEKEIIHYMKKYKTDILINEDGNLYTRLNRGLTKVNHEKLRNYLNTQEYHESIS